MFKSGLMLVCVNRDFLECYKIVLCSNRWFNNEFLKMDGYSLLLVGNKMYKIEVLGSI